MGISFDGGLQADGFAQNSCHRQRNDRITSTLTEVPTSGTMAWTSTDDCGTGGAEERHSFDMVDFSNTNYAAITAGSRPAGPAAYPRNLNQDCNVGEFFMNDVMFTNVESAFLTVADKEPR